MGNAYTDAKDPHTTNTSDMKLGRNIRKTRNIAVEIIRNESCKQLLDKCAPKAYNYHTNYTNNKRKPLQLQTELL